MIFSNEAQLIIRVFFGEFRTEGARGEHEKISPIFGKIFWIFLILAGSLSRTIFSPYKRIAFNFNFNVIELEHTSEQAGQWEQSRPSTWYESFATKDITNQHDLPTT